MAPSNRSLPRPFNYQWGNGRVVRGVWGDTPPEEEEACYLGAHHESAIQLLEYDEGEAAGSWSVRFCFYNREGRFQRSPLLVGADDLDGLRAALKRSPRLRELLKRLVEES